MDGDVSDLAPVAGVALGADTVEGLQAVLAHAAVQAGFGVTLVDLVLAVGSSEAGAAGTGVAVDLVDAGAPIEAGAVANEGGGVGGGEMG